MTSKRAADVKRRLRAGEIVYSAWLTFNSPAVAEVIAGSGFEVLLIDMEHTSMSLETLEAVLASVGRWDPVTVLRVPSHDPSFIKRVLDIGVDGIMAPQVMNEAEARAVIASVKYPPVGKRGFGPRRTSDYFRNPAYFDEANDNTFVMLQIEHFKAAEEADKIAALPGLDVLCLGPADLAVSCGKLKDTSHPSVTGAIDRVFAAAEKNGLPVCMGRYETASDQVELVRRGARFVIASDDLVVLRHGLVGHLAEAKRLLEGGAGGKSAESAYGGAKP